MSWKATMRAMEASRKRLQREAKQRERQLQREAKDVAQLSAKEQARLEVATYENALEVLLSVHKESADPVDWLAIAASLPPVPPGRQSRNETKARQRVAFSPASEDAEVIIDQAKQQDERECQEAVQAHTADVTEWERMSKLARRILRGDAGAYHPAIEELRPLSEVTRIGPSFRFTVHNSRLVEVALSTKGSQLIPTELKTLTASGKVSVKPMPKGRFVETYQDCICSCVLRVARELFALLPIETLLIAASAEALEPDTGQVLERPFLSVAIPRATLSQLDFDTLDPSDSVMGMTHRGDLKASRKTGDFERITPLSIADLPEQDAGDGASFDTLLTAAKRLSADLKAQCAAMTPEVSEAMSESGESS